MPTIEVDRVNIPFHALYRCVQRTKNSMHEAGRIIKEVLASGETKWVKKPPKGVKRKKSQEGVHYGIHDGLELLVVFDENGKHGYGFVPTTYRWDPLAEEARA
jgi:hypothetical protein